MTCTFINSLVRPQEQVCARGCVWDVWPVPLQKASQYQNPRVKDCLHAFCYERVIFLSVEMALNEWRNWKVNPSSSLNSQNKVITNLTLRNISQENALLRFVFLGYLASFSPFSDLMLYRWYQKTLTAQLAYLYKSCSSKQLI